MKIVLVLIVLGACVSEGDPRWQLDHDRIVAVRATPAHIPSGARATLDALVAHAGAPTDVEVPVVVGAPTAPPSLAGALQPDGSIVAPDAAALDQARAELGIPGGVPVPLEVIARFGDLAAQKTIYLGDAADNPTMPAITIDHAPAPASGEMITIAFDRDVPMAVDADAMARVSWLTSVGTMHDDDEHAA
ncbi:MAG TPA: hypothetical protein VL463_31215, partial [Kofleriaceae bacterium]|nr:hypothetical protein [Kofleriaceae bacterium]